MPPANPQKRDVEAVLEVHAALMQALVAAPGGRDDPEAMKYVSALCASAIEAVNDLDARVTLRGIESLARLLFSADGGNGVRSGALQGVAALKLQLFNALSNLRGRLQFLQRLPPSFPERPALSANKNVSILVVEDNFDSAESLRKLLELCGYKVTTAHSSLEGLEAAQRMSPDIILCDIGLPDTDGYALASALRSNPATSNARLIAVTAYGSPQDAERSRLAGFEVHLVKPVKPETLLQELDSTAPKH